MSDILVSQRPQQTLVESDVILEIVNGLSTDIEVTRHGVNAFVVRFIASVINVAPNSGK